MSRRQAVALACVAVTAAVAGGEFRYAFGWAPLGGRILVAAVLPPIVALGVLRRPAGVPASIRGTLASFAVLLVTLAALTLPDTALGGVLPTPATVTALFDGLVHGPARILGTTVPAPAEGGLLVVPAVLTWCASAVGAEVVLRSRRALAALVPAIVVLVAAAAFGARDVDPPVWPSVAFVLGAAVLARLTAGDAGARDAEGASTTRWRRSVPVVAAMATTVACGALFGPRLPWADARQPFDARGAPPVQPLSTVDPLALVSAWAADPDPVQFRVHAPRPTRLRMAVLDEYEPERGWTTHARLRAAGTRLSTEEDAGPKATVVAQEVVIEELGGVWLPNAFRPTRVEGHRVLVDTKTGMMASADGLRPGVRYRVWSEVADVPDCTYAAVPPAPGVVVPVELATLATRVTEGAKSPCDRAHRLQAFLRARPFEFDKEAPSGNSIAMLRTFLRDTEIGMRGTSEQFASAFALLGRAVGLPTRVVVGFGHGDDVGGGLRTVRAAHGAAWPEVRFEGLGWVPFDPTPTEGEERPVMEAPQDDVAAVAPTSSSNVTEGDGEGTEPVAVPLDGGGSRGSLRRWLVVGAGALIVGAAPAAGALVAFVRRRRAARRRGAADLRVRAMGAWDHAVDSLSDHGIRRDTTLTASQYVGRCRRRLGPEAEAALTPVARLANTARFAAEPPTPAEVAEAWARAEQVCAIARTSLGRSRRVLRLVDVRVLTSPALGERPARSRPRTPRGS